MVKNFAMSAGDECRACQKTIVGEGVRCSDCERLNHLSCTGLPTYALVCMAVTIRTYICPECVTKKKNAQMSYEDALRKIEHLFGVEAAAAGTAAANSVAIGNQIEERDSAESTGDPGRDQTRINHSVIGSTASTPSGSQTVNGLDQRPEGDENDSAPSNRAVETEKGKNLKICVNTTKLESASMEERAKDAISHIRNYAVTSLDWEIERGVDVLEAISVLSIILLCVGK